MNLRYERVKIENRHMTWVIGMAKRFSCSGLSRVSSWFTRDEIGSAIVVRLVPDVLSCLYFTLFGVLQGRKFPTMLISAAQCLFPVEAMSSREVRDG